MPDRAAESGGIAIASTPVWDGRPGERSVARYWSREASIRMVVWFDYLVGSTSLFAAVGVIGLKILKDDWFFVATQQNLVFRLIAALSQSLSLIGLENLPGWHDSGFVWDFTNAGFVDAYLFGMFTADLAAFSVCVKLGSALGRYRPGARRTQIAISALLLLMLGSYSVGYAQSGGPSIGLAVISIMTAVPAWILFVLFSPPAPLMFGEEYRRAIREASHERPRIPFLLLFVGGIVFAMFIAGAIFIVVVGSIPVAAHIRRLFVPMP